MTDASDAELAALYEGCRFLVFPSLAEGWGLPIREALRFGKPSIVTDAIPSSDVSRFVEIVPAGDGDALYQVIRRWWDDPEPVESRIRAIRERVRAPKLGARVPRPAGGYPLGRWELKSKWTPTSVATGRRRGACGA